MLFDLVKTHQNIIDFSPTQTIDTLNYKCFVFNEKPLHLIEYIKLKVQSEIASKLFENRIKYKT